eukprot:6178144-Pleurochrysis_carterae.AAC.1
MSVTAASSGCWRQNRSGGGELFVLVKALRGDEFLRATFDLTALWHDCDEKCDCRHDTYARIGTHMQRTHSLIPCRCMRSHELARPGSLRTQTGEPRATAGHRCNARPSPASP